MCVSLQNTDRVRIYLCMCVCAKAFLLQMVYCDSMTLFDVSTFLDPISNDYYFSSLLGVYGNDHHLFDQFKYVFNLFDLSNFCFQLKPPVLIFNYYH